MPKKNCNNCANYLDKENSQNVKIAVLDEQMNETKLFIKDMKENHLPHIYEGINAINLKIAYAAGAVVVLTAITQIAIKYFWK